MKKSRMINLIGRSYDEMKSYINNSVRSIKRLVAPEIDFEDTTTLEIMTLADNTVDMMNDQLSIAKEIAIQNAIDADEIKKTQEAILEQFKLMNENLKAINETLSMKQ